MKRDSLAPVVVGSTHTLYKTKRPRAVQLGDPDRLIGTVRRQRDPEQDDAGDVALPIVRTARGSLLYPRCPHCGADLARVRDAPKSVRDCRGCGARFLDSRFVTAG